MSSSSPVLSLHQALAHAVLKDLQPVTRSVVDFDRIPQGTRPPMNELPRKDVLCRPEDRDVSVVLFPQTWGSTALGYGGLGGAAMTTAYSVVVQTLADACVYFGVGRLAYHCVFEAMTSEQRESFQKDIGKQSLCARAEAQSRYGAMIPERA